MAKFRDPYAEWSGAQLDKVFRRAANLDATMTSLASELAVRYVATHFGWEAKHPVELIALIENALGERR